MEQEGTSKEDHCSSLNPLHSDINGDGSSNSQEVPSSPAENIQQDNQSINPEESKIEVEVENTSSEAKSFAPEGDSAILENSQPVNCDQQIEELKHEACPSESQEDCKKAEESENTANKQESKDSSEESKELHMFTNQWTFWYVYTMSHEERKRK